MYNLFHQRHDPTIVCAVRRIGETPRFLGKDHWEFDGTSDRLATDVPDFDHAAAAAVIDQTGFYLYARH